jgi:hypothetical protein
MISFQEISVYHDTPFPSFFAYAIAQVSTPATFFLPLQQAISLSVGLPNATVA